MKQPKQTVHLGKYAPGRKSKTWCGRSTSSGIFWTSYSAKNTCLVCQKALRAYGGRKKVTS